MFPFLMVFIGGGLGSVCRYGISLILPKSDGIPWATFTANAISCIVLGFLIGYQLNKGISTKYSLLLLTGFCGGFSTFSTFSAETYHLMQNGQTLLALAYVALSVLFCLVCIYLGLKIQNFG